ncbi:hypothetical protein ASG93_24760 [Paenibacillus sp. Soil787]|nr:hypothetical protein ASG93_24760 [Paenibacillus sp. Soil787]
MMDTFLREAQVCYKMMDTFLRHAQVSLSDEVFQFKPPPLPDLYDLGSVKVKFSPIGIVELERWERLI